MSSTIISLLWFPVVLFISIPFAISAYITFCISGLVVFARLFLISLELASEIIYAAVTKNFFPKFDSSSLFNLISEPTTPQVPSTSKRRSADYGLTPYPPTTSIHRLPLSRSQSDLTRSYIFRRHSSQSSDGIFDPGIYPLREDSHMNPTYAPSAALLSLISGDEGRDFEGLGGWRCGPSKVHGTTANTTNRASRSSSYSAIGNNGTSEADDDDNNDDYDKDERAWLSINRRLELPSQPLNHRNSVSDLSEHALPWRHRQMTSGRGDSSPTLRHHHRSATTTMLSSLARHERQFNSFDMSPSTTPDLNAVSPRSRPISPRSQSEDGVPGRFSSIDRRLIAPPAERDKGEGGGYFTIQPYGSGMESDTTSLRSLSPGEERRGVGSVGRSVAHYPAGVRYRRRSFSGPGPGPVSPLSPLRTNRSMAF